MANYMRLTLQLNAIDNMSKVVQGAASRSMRSLDSVVANAQKRASQARSNMLESGMLAAGGAAALAYPLKAAANYERLRVTMIALTGSSEKGLETYRKVIELAAKTPLRLAEVAKATTMMIGYGATANQAVDDVKLLGDITALTNGQLDNAIVAYGQARQEGKLLTRDIRQMVNAGVPVVKMFQNMYGSGVDVMDMASKGQITFQKLEAVLKASTQAGGQFHNGLEVLAGTGEGLFARLADTVVRFAAVFGDSLLPPLKSFGEAMIPIIEKTGKWFENHQVLTKSIGALTAAITTASTAVFAYNAIVWIANMGTVSIAGSIKWLSFQFFRLRFAIFTSNLSWAAMVGWMQLARMRVITFAIATWTGFIPAVVAGASAVAGWTASVWAFTTAILSVPIVGWALAAVAALAGISVVIYKNWDAITGFLSSTWQKFKDFIPKAKAWGTELIRSIVDGVKSAAPLLFAALDSAMAFARGFFPASPAKRGAFKDIQRIKIIEQVAKNIKPNSLAPAMQKATEGGVGAIGGSGSSLVLAPTGGGGSVTSVTYSPSITIGAGVSKEDKESFTALLERHKLELARMVGEVTRSQARKSFA